MFTHAITRTPGPDFAQGITTSSALGAPSYDLILRQHAAYVDTLRGLGLNVTVLDALPGLPDAYFVEDPAIMMPEIAILTLPGAPARRGEVAAIEAAVAAHRAAPRQSACIEPPGTLEGGDVLLVDHHFFVGLSDRTNSEGASQLGEIVAKYGYAATSVPVEAGLHLKSSVNYVGKNALLLTEPFAQMDVFANYNHLIVDPAEEYACNTLWINDTLITPAGFPNTRRQLETLNLPIIEIDVSEARKMDGGLTCMSLRF